MPIGQLSAWLSTVVTSSKRGIPVTRLIPTLGRVTVIVSIGQLQAYRELKHGLGLDHFEGRTWPGWHHHVTLVNAAHLFITIQRLSADPKARGAA